MASSTITLPVYSHITDVVVVDALTAAKADIEALQSEVVAATATPLTVTAALHADGIAATLPASTGTGNRYLFFVGTSASGGSYVISADAGAVFKGSIIIPSDAGDAVEAFEAGATDNTITLNGSTKGGLAGGHVEVIDVATNVWFVRGVSAGTGDEVTPFSAV
jgi:hypothetical protein